MLDRKTACDLRAIGIDPAKLPAGTMVCGKPIDDLPETQKTPKGPNKTEAAWMRHLDYLTSAGIVNRYWYEPMRLRLTDPDPQTKRPRLYVPDFLVIMAVSKWSLRPRIVEIKGGYVREDAGVKFDQARNEYGSAFRFSMIRKTKAGWETIRGETWRE